MSLIRTDCNVGNYSQAALDVEYESLPDLDGRGARFRITPEDQEVSLTWCEMKDGLCERVSSVRCDYNVTNLQSFTKYNVTAEALDSNETSVRVFKTDCGSESR